MALYGTRVANIVPEMSTGAVGKRIGTLTGRQTLGGTLNVALNSALGRTRYKEIGLNEKYPSPDYPEPIYNKCETNISTLSNGMRVVSRMTNDPICNIGVCHQIKHSIKLI